MAFQEISKNYLNSLMERLFYHPLYYQEQEIFLLFYSFIWMIQILLCYYLGHLCNIPTNFLMFSNNYHCIWLNFTLAPQHLNILHYLSVLVTFLYPMTSAMIYLCTRTCTGWEYITITNIDTRMINNNQSWYELIT